VNWCTCCGTPWRFFVRIVSSRRHFTSQGCGSTETYNCKEEGDLTSSLCSWRRSACRAHTTRRVLHHGRGSHQLDTSVASSCSRSSSAKSSSIFLERLKERNETYATDNKTNDAGDNRQQGQPVHHERHGVTEQTWINKMEVTRCSSRRCRFGSRSARSWTSTHLMTTSSALFLNTVRATNSSE